MALKTFAECKTYLGSAVRETDTNTITLFGSFLNLTLEEMHTAHPWNSLRRKQTFDTVANQEDYNLDEEVDRIALVRQIATPHKLWYLPDHLFYQYVPNPENRGSAVPHFYRLWEETGFTTNLAAADTVYVSSTSNSDGATFTVVLVGRDSNGLVVTESFTLNGLTAVTSATTFASAGLFQVSKSAATTGTITVYRTTGATVLARMSPAETAPRSKRISLYPIPSSAVTTYVEYYERLRLLVNDADVPQMDHQWHWVLLEGALAKCWDYKQNAAAFLQHQTLFESGLRQMIQQDLANQDYVPILHPRLSWPSTVQRYADSINDAYPVYGVSF